MSLGSLFGGAAGSKVGKAVVEMVGDTTKLKKDFAEAKAESASATGAMGKNMDGFKALAVAGAATAGAALVAFAADAVKAFQEAQKVTAQTEAVLESTGGQAGVTAAEVQDLADTIQDYSGVSDEVIRKGENMLLTFTNIKNRVGEGNDVFNQSVGILADMSVALGTDIQKQAIQLGKALNDPIKGISALRRVGVAFTEEQQEQINTLVESGRAMEAQKIILAELKTEFGGSAAAAGDTFAGKIAILSANFNDLQEKIGGVIVQGLIPIVDKMNDLIEALNSIPDPVKKAFGDALPDAIHNALQQMPGLTALVAVFDATSAVSDDVAESAEGTVGPVERQTDATVDLVRQTTYLNEQLRDQLENQQALAGGYLGLLGAANSMRDAQKALNDAQARVNKLQENGKEGTEKYTEAVKARRDAELNAVQSVAALDSAAARYKAQLEESGLSQGKVNEKLREYAEKAGLSDRQTNNLLKRVAGLNEQFGKLPPKKEIPVAAPGAEDARRAFSELAATIAGIPNSITTFYRVVGSGAQASGASGTGHGNLAQGGVIRAAAGVVTGPTFLVGEGARRTFAGRGAEAVIPFDERGIGILAEALSRAGGGSSSDSLLLREIRDLLRHGNRDRRNNSYSDRAAMGLV